MLRALVIYVCCCVLITMVIFVAVELVYAMAERKETKLRCPTIKFKMKKQKSTRSLAQQMNAVQRKMRKNKPNKNYQSLHHSKFILVYHIIFVCKYRNKLLIKYGKDIKQIMFDISKKYDFDIK